MASQRRSGGSIGFGLGGRRIAGVIGSRSGFASRSSASDTSSTGTSACGVLRPGDARGDDSAAEQSAPANSAASPRKTSSSNIGRQDDRRHDRQPTDAQRKLLRDHLAERVFGRFPDLRCRELDRVNRRGGDQRWRPRRRRPGATSHGSSGQNRPSALPTSSEPPTGPGSAESRITRPVQEHQVRPGRYPGLTPASSPATKG